MTPDGPESGEAKVVALIPPSRGAASHTAVYRVGGREYPLKTNPNCYVCNSPHRVQIEEGVLKGYSYASVARGLPDRTPDEVIQIQPRHISDHVKNRHLPMDLVVRRAIMEERATQIGKSIEDAETAIIDHIGFARLGLQRVVERMAAGEIKPSMQDGIEFAKILLKLDEIMGDQGGVDQQVIFRGFLSYMQAIQGVCTPDQVREIGKRISRDPVIRGLLQKATAENTVEVEEEAHV